MQAEENFCNEPAGCKTVARSYRKCARYFYSGEKYSLRELSEMSGIGMNPLAMRLRRGWSVEKAVETPVAEPLGANSGIPKPNMVWICFDVPIGGVFESMQPKLHTPYLAEKSASVRKQCRFREYYIIRLENGKPLIVYSGEFRFL